MGDLASDRVDDAIKELGEVADRSYGEKKNNYNDAKAIVQKHTGRAPLIKPAHDDYFCG